MIFIYNIYSKNNRLLNTYMCVCIYIYIYIFYIVSIIYEVIGNLIFEITDVST